MGPGVMRDFLHLNLQVEIKLLFYHRELKLCIIHLVTPLVEADNVWVGFTPCFDCPVAYQFRINNNQDSQFAVTEVHKVINVSTPNILEGVNKPTTFRIQTFPRPKGELNFKLQKVTEDVTGKVTTSPVVEFNITVFKIPFGITYAVFGGSEAKSAKFQFRDGI